MESPDALFPTPLNNFLSSQGADNLYLPLGFQPSIRLLSFHFPPRIEPSDPLLEALLFLHLQYRTIALPGTFAYSFKPYIFPTIGGGFKALNNLICSPLPLP